MKILIIGKNGQLAWELQKTKPEKKIHCDVLGSSQCDISNGDKVRETVQRLKPDVIINTAAYTAVDRAEQDKDRAYAVNADGPGFLAAAARKIKARMIHISTDFVFDGCQYRPYSPIDIPRPSGVYGTSKLEGERRVMEELADQALIIRTSWLYSCHGQNFVKTMLNLMKERDEIRVVADQVGTPTWARGLAGVIWQMVDRAFEDTICHWSDAGVASWYDFAMAVFEEARALGLLNKDVLITPIPTEEYPTAAKRPYYSVLDKTYIWKLLQIRPVHWRRNLSSMLKELQNGG